MRPRRPGGGRGREVPADGRGQGRGHRHQKSVYQTIQDGDPTPELLAIEYLEALALMADGQATKIVLPTESSAVLGALGGIRELLDGGPPAKPRPPRSGAGAASAREE